ncbi:MAG TPA: phage holin family protein [Noviherbaspirillum sp.]|nr:phage holin family protein [Noviherbaspirillum sp.]
MEQQHSGAGHEKPGLAAGLAGIARNVFGLLVSRIELAALELGEVRDNLARLLFIGALGIVAILFALGAWTALLVVLAWDTMGWKILLLVAIVYTLLAIGILRHARAYLEQDKLSLNATMSELRKDRDALL